MRSCFHLLGFCILTILHTGCNFKSNHADLILHNAVGLVCDGSPLNASSIAIAIENGKIVATGPEREILNSFNADVKIDLRQSVVYPGLIDAHAHFTGYALSTLEVDLVGSESYDEVLSRLKTYLALYYKYLIIKHFTHCM